MRFPPSRERQGGEEKGNDGGGKRERQHQTHTLSKKHMKQYIFFLK